MTVTGDVPGRRWVRLARQVHRRTPTPWALTTVLMLLVYAYLVGYTLGEALLTRLVLPTGGR